MKKKLVWDAGGVIFQFDLLQALSSFQDGKYASLIQTMCSGADWEAFDRGDLTFSELSEDYATQFSVKKEVVSHIINHLFDSLTPNWPVIRIIRALKSMGYEQVCLTNGSNEYFSYVTSGEYAKKHRFSIADLFDIDHEVVVSAPIHLRKPEEAIYQHAATKFGFSDHDEIIFIDDNKNYVRAASQFGWQSILYHPQLDLCSALESYGVKHPCSMLEEASFERLNDSKPTLGKQPK